MHVKLGGRTFIVSFDGTGSVRTISERKLHAAGKPWAAYHNAPYWHADHHKVGGPKTIVAQIITATTTAGSTKAA